MSARKSKQKQLALKKLAKSDIAAEKILSMAGEEVVATYFLKKRNHPESLMEIDPELLVIVL
jgi:ABC-type hemin transport system substrate-binding protein